MATKSPAERRAAMVRLVESRTVTRVAPPLLLPAGPYLDLAGEEFGRQLLLTTANNGIEYCLRPDFTLPIAKSYLDDGMMGVPGAAYLGASLVADLDFATVAPDGRSAVTLKAGKLSLVRFGAELQTEALAENYPTPTLSSWSSDSRAVALYGAEAGIHIWRGIGAPAQIMRSGFAGRHASASSTRSRASVGGP